MRSKLTAQRLREVLSYSPGRGEFVWLRRMAQTDRTGQVAGSLHKQGYIIIQIDGVPERAHRLAWLYVHGEWPAGQIDHINGDRADNRLCNLRDVPGHINQQNQRCARKGSSSGLLGVTWHKAAGKWAAQIAVGNRKRHLGVFDTPDLAHEAYVKAKRYLHPGGTL